MRSRNPRRSWTRWAGIAAVILILAPVVFAEIGLSPGDHDFGELEVGESTAPQAFVVTNVGDEDVIVKSVTVFQIGGQDFQLLNPLTEALTIPVGEDATFNVVFEPASGGSKTAQLQVLLDGSSLPDARATLTGTGLAPPPDAVVPAEGTIGTTITMKVDGAGAGRAKVWLEWTDEKSGKTKKKSLKVGTPTTTRVTATVKAKLAPGVYRVKILPKGKGAEVIDQGFFEIKLPEVTFLNFDSAKPGEQLVAQGWWFGDKKARPKVSFVYEDPDSGKEKQKKCKLNKRLFSYVPETGASTIRFYVPKVRPVTGRLVMKTKIGTAVLASEFEVTE